MKGLRDAICLKLDQMYLSGDRLNQDHQQSVCDIGLATSNVSTSLNSVHTVPRPGYNSGGLTC